ncbi:DNA-directed RNA polymerase subunit A'' [Halopiger xanaduensis]|uniref:DNA-directed RNA polymerase subunit Rpo1C n=1 Tax=Halopiger xanaduensis (strain DSM 18323 / JCM 14033 / SH-6) TaxID=797210 RepID=F8D7J8_HALXS|nr:DNA-directed RNA polymerase subunit A'' [Halopiger xanaduensis]AEH36364.1 DNA-directed RNA polymerase, subunit A'' [Halopiger xanaduensis SH-6]
MTEVDYDVSDDVIVVVEDTDLPRRLKDNVYEELEGRTDATVEDADELAKAVESRYVDTRVDPLDPVGTVSAQSIGEPGTQLTMNTFHYAGVAEIDVTQGLPRLIELVDARKTPDTPMMTVYLEDEYATEREKAHEVVWNIEATKILALGDVSTNVADMRVQISLNEDTLRERMIEPEEVAEIIEDNLGVKAIQQGTQIQFGPEEPSYRDLLQLVEELREITFKGIEDISRVVIRREEMDHGDEEFVLYTEGSAFGDVLEIEGVDASRTTCNNIHEIHRNLGIEAAREAIIEETNNTLAEQGLDDVNVRHLMLVADIMTNRGEIESIGRHGISGSKDSVLARAAFEVTVNHLLNAAIHGEVDKLQGVTENVIVGKPIKLGTGDVDLRMGSTVPDGGSGRGSGGETQAD